MMTSDDSDVGAGAGAKSNKTTSAPAPLSGAAAAAHPADVEFDKNLRIAVLIAEVILGTVGGVLVCVWLWRNCRRRSRIIAIIMNVTATDLLVICFACTMQLVWELVDRNWMAGDLMCRALKWGQSFTIMSSNYMLVVLSVDRHEAIRSPLKKSISVMKMAAIGYGAAALLSLPQAGVFRQNYVTSTGIFFNKTVCEPIFRHLPDWHRELYLVFISIVVFYVPIVIIAFCYVRIYLKISRKTSDGLAASALPAAPASASSSKKARRPGKVLLQSTRSSSLPKAKTKILKMTVVIVSTFVVFGLPYHVLEMVVSFGYHSLVGPTSMAVFGAMAVANSAVNPYVFLLFNAAGGDCCCLRRRQQQQQQKQQARRADDNRLSQTDNAQQQTTNCFQFDSRTTGDEAVQRSSAERYVMSHVQTAKT